jgi:hypothetical protein
MFHNFTVYKFTHLYIYIVIQVVNHPNGYASYPPHPKNVIQLQVHSY